MSLKTLFPTLVKEAALGTDAMRAELEAVCWLLEDEDTAGNDW